MSETWKPPSAHCRRQSCYGSVRIE
jgi:hypothetical protein